MIHIIPIIVRYVGGDLSTNFAREHVEKMEKKLVYNSDGPMGLLLEKKELHTNFVSIYALVENGYFSLDLLEKMKPYLPWFSVFQSDRTPLEFIVKNRDKCPIGFYGYPRLPIDILRGEAKITPYFSTCDFILRNPALFSEGVEEGEKIVDIIIGRKKTRLEEAAENLSRNVGAPLIFFLRNPQYISWKNICNNQGKVLRGEMKATVAFLNSGKGEWTKEHWSLISLNPATPLQFYEENWESLDTISLSSNTSVPLSYWREYMCHLEDGSEFPILIKNPTVPFSLVCENLKYYEPSRRSFLLQGSYNVPVDGIVEMAEKNPQVIDWDTIALNRGFWIHLAERELAPVLRDFFGGVGVGAGN